MILTMYIILLIITFLLIGFGFWIDNPVLEIGGFFFLFVLGLLLMGGSIQYKTSEYVYESYVYGNNFTYPNGTATYHWDYSASGVPPQADKGVFLFHKYFYTNDIYTNFDKDTSGEILGSFSVNHLLGLLLSVLGGFGMAISSWNMRVKG